MPWAKYAAQPDAEAKPWEKYAASAPVGATQSTAPSDSRNSVQRAFDEFTRPRMDGEEDGMPTPMGAGGRGLRNIGRGIIGGLASPFVHPLQTLKGGADIGSAVLSNNPWQMSKALHIPELAQSFVEHPAETAESTGGNLLGGALLGEGIGEAGGALSRSLAGPMERGGLNLGNAALGARGPKPFKYGANPARGAFEEGVLPAWGKHSASMKLADALPEIGQRISDKVMAGGNAPLTDIAHSIEGPANEARSIIEGPGGGNRSVDPIDALVNSMRSKAPGASRPIYGPDAGTPYTADEAVKALSGRQRLALPAPKEEIPLPDTAPGRTRLSQPITLESSRALPREFPPYGTNDPLTPTYGGLRGHEYIGEIPGERGGAGQPGGVLRRSPEFPESSQPSPFSDLRHPHATAPDVWRTIQNIDKNTRFNPDPEVEGVNELRRDMRGGLRGNLEDAVPGLKPDTQRYSDLKSAEETLDRTLHGGASLRKMLSVPTFPIESAVGRALYGAGKAMAKPSVFENTGRAAGLVQSLRDKKKEQ